MALNRVLSIRPVPSPHSIVLADPLWLRLTFPVLMLLVGPILLYFSLSSSSPLPPASSTHVSQGAASPAQAMMELAILKASERYAQSLWCAVAFWVALAFVLAVVGHRIHRRARRSTHH
jgi:hypothetical protein